MANTAISDFFETLRFMLEDRDPTIRLYPDAQLLTAVRTCIRLQLVPGYAIETNLVEITPAVTEPKDWALIALETVLLYVKNNPGDYSYKTRAVSERFGSWDNYLDELKLQVYKLKNSCMFSGWYSYYTWFAGMYGLPLNMVMAQLNVRAPFYTATIGTDGTQISTS